MQDSGLPDTSNLTLHRMSSNLHYWADQNAVVVFLTGQCKSGRPPQLGLLSHVDQDGHLPGEGHSLNLSKTHNIRGLLHLSSLYTIDWHNRTEDHSRTLYRTFLQRQSGSPECPFGCKVQLISIVLPCRLKVPPLACGILSDANPTEQSLLRSYAYAAEKYCRILLY